MQVAVVHYLKGSNVSVFARIEYEDSLQKTGSSSRDLGNLAAGLMLVNSSRDRSLIHLISLQTHT